MSNLTDAELKIEYNLTDEELGYFKEDMFAQEGSVIAKDGASFAETVIDPSKAVKPSVLESSVKPTVGSRVRDFAGRVGANLFQGKPLLQAGPGKISATGSPLVSTGAGNVPTGGQAAAAPFSGTAYAGNQPTPTTTIDGSVEDKPTMASRARDFAGKVGTNVVSSLAVGYATESAFGDGSTGGYGSNLRTEGASSNENLRIYAVERGIDVGSIYNNMTYGTAEPSFAAGSSLYNQATVGVPE